MEDPMKNLSLDEAKEQEIYANQLEMEMMKKKERVRKTKVPKSRETEIIIVDPRETEEIKKKEREREILEELDRRRAATMMIEARKAAKIDNCPACSRKYNDEKGEDKYFLCCGENLCVNCDDPKIQTAKDNKEEYLCPHCKGSMWKEEEVFSLTLMYADEGEAWAQYKVAVAYKTGDGCTKSHEKSVEYFLLAIKQDYARAQAVFGQMNYMGVGVPQGISFPFIFNILLKYLFTIVNKK